MRGAPGEIDSGARRGTRDLTMTQPYMPAFAEAATGPQSCTKSTLSDAPRLQKFWERVERAGAHDSGEPISPPARYGRQPSPAESVGVVCQPKLAGTSGERKLAVRQGFEPWIQ